MENWDPASSNAPCNMNGEALSILNVGTGIDCSIKELAEQIAQTVNYNGDIVWDTDMPDGTPKKQLDIKKMTAMGWSARIPLAEGLKTTYADFLERRKTKILRE